MITGLLLPAALAFIMFAMGLTMAPGDFKQAFTKPKALGVGVAAKLLVLPPLGFLAAYLFGLSADFAIGLVILASCPAGVTSSLLTHHAKGRIALSASVTAISSLAVVVSLPLVVGFALDVWGAASSGGELAVGKMVLGILLVDFLPLILGLIVQMRRPQWARAIGGPARRTATFLFFLIVLGAFASQFTTLLVHGQELLAPVAFLNLAAMLAGYAAARLFGLRPSERAAVVMENGLQNSALGIFVALTLLRSEAMLAPVIVYALFMNLSALAAVLLFRKSA